MSERAQGTVKWFSRGKGYGFIQPDGATEDVFVHYSTIAGEGFRNLERGERVELAIEDTSMGPQAAQVLRLGVQRSPEGMQTEEATEPEAVGPELWD